MVLNALTHGEIEAGQTVPVDQDRLNVVARRINDLCRTATLDLAYHVGEVVILGIYGGDIEAWVREGIRAPSYRKLVQRADLLMSPSALCRSVAIYQLCERVGGRTSWKHLGTSHLQEVLSLPPTQQDRLLAVAEAERWPVSRLRAEVSKRRPPRRNQYKTRLQKVARMFRAFQAAVDDHMGNSALDESSSEQLLGVVGEARRYLDDIEATLRSPGDQGTKRESVQRLACPAPASRVAV